MRVEKETEREGERERQREGERERERKEGDGIFFPRHPDEDRNTHDNILQNYFSLFPPHSVSKYVA